MFFLIVFVQVVVASVKHPLRQQIHHANLSLTIPAILLVVFQRIFFWKAEGRESPKEDLATKEQKQRHAIWYSEELCVCRSLNKVNPLAFVDGISRIWQWIQTSSECWRELSATAHCVLVSLLLFSFTEDGIFSNSAYADDTSFRNATLSSLPVFS